jgi:hypothetical protein
MRASLLASSSSPEAMISFGPIVHCCRRVTGGRLTIAERSQCRQGRLKGNLCVASQRSEMKLTERPMAVSAKQFFVDRPSASTELLRRAAETDLEVASPL